MSAVARCIGVLAALAVLGLATPASAQPDPVDELTTGIARRAAEISALEGTRRASGAPVPAQGRITINRDFQLIFLATTPELALQGEQVSIRALQALEDRRADKQVGDGGGSTAGSTSLASKGGTPALLAFAVENGALARDISGTTVTFRGTPVGLIRALGNTGYFDTLATDDGAVAVLQKFSFSASFDTSRGSSNAGQPTLRANRNQFSAAALRVSLVDRKDPRAAINDDRWAAFARQVDDSASVAALTALLADPAVTAWIGKANAAIDAAAVDSIETVVIGQFRELGAIPLRPETRTAVEAATRELRALLQRRADVLRDIAGGAQLVLDWSYQRPQDETTSSNFKVVGSVGRSFLLTANAALTFYHGALAVGTDRVRDIQAALQVDVPFGNPDTLGRYAVTLATKVQHLPEDVLAPEGVLFPGTKGTIWLGQIKLTIPVRGLAAKMPLSVTLANRTELIPEKKVFARANIGFSYDLDAVFARFKP